MKTLPGPQDLREGFLTRCFSGRIFSGEVFRSALRSCKVTMSCVERDDGALLRTFGGNKMHQIILISGKQGSGKTTLQNALIKELLKASYVALKINFADAIYKMHDDILSFIKQYGIKRDIKKDGPLLQLLGTEWGRKTISENIWIDILKGRIKNFVTDSVDNPQNKFFFIVGDCRFQNELSAFPDALKIRLECNAGVRRQRCEQWRDNDMHASEIDLDGQLKRFDMVFDTAHFSVASIIAQVMEKLEIK